MNKNLSIVDRTQLALDKAGRTFAGQGSVAEREARSIANLRAAFPGVTAKAEARFVARLHRNAARVAGEQIVRQAEWAAWRAARAVETPEQARARVADGLRRLRAGECGFIGRMIAAA